MVPAKSPQEVRPVVSITPRRYQRGARNRSGENVSRRLQVVVKILEANFLQEIFSQQEVMIYKNTQRFQFQKFSCGNGKGGYKTVR